MVKGTGTLTLEKRHVSSGEGTCGHHCNSKSNDRGRWLLEFASYKHIWPPPHKTSRKIPWHSPDGKIHNQIDYIMVKKRFKTSVNIAKTRSFPGADIGSDHELVMMTFELHLKRAKKNNAAQGSHLASRS